jgi:hypothetical protein
MKALKVESNKKAGMNKKFIKIIFALAIVAILSTVVFYFIAKEVYLECFGELNSSGEITEERAVVTISYHPTLDVISQNGLPPLIGWATFIDSGSYLYIRDLRGMALGEYNKVSDRLYWEISGTDYDYVYSAICKRYIPALAVEV